MKKVLMFYLSDCPYCNKAFRYEKELIRDKPEYEKVQIERIEESENQEFAEKFDYYFVPCYYVDGKKVAEGALSKENVEKIFIAALAD